MIAATFILLGAIQLVYGQYRLPSGVDVTCHLTDSTCLSDEAATRTMQPATFNPCCVSNLGTLLTENADHYYQVGTGDCRQCNDGSVSRPTPDSDQLICFTNDACTESAADSIQEPGEDGNTCCNGETPQAYFTLNGVCGTCLACEQCTIPPSVGDDPHFFLPLRNGDNMCFSVQGEPNFAFSLISDKHVTLNAQFVLPAEEESLTINDVSTFLGSLGLVITSPTNSNLTTTIKVSAEEHSVLVGNSLTVVKDKPVIIDVNEKITVTVNEEVQMAKLKDESAWLTINTNAGFGIKVRFYKRHLDMFLTKTSGLTEEADGLIGQFLGAKVEVDADAKLLKFANRPPIPVKEGPAWAFLGIPDNCWYGMDTDNQATGIIRGVHTEYIVDRLV